MAEEFDRDAIMKKIRGMLELADPERGGTQGEIENAARMAKVLMDKYNVSMLDVMKEKKDDPNLFISRDAAYSVAKMKAWHWSLARAIDRIVGTKHYSSHAYGHSERRKRDAKNAPQFWVAKMTFFGLKETVEVACDLFDKWADRIDRMATQAVSEYIEELEEEFAEEMLYQHVKQVRFLRGLGDRHPQVWRNSWLDGCLSGIHMAIYEEEEKKRDEERKARGLRPLAGLSYVERRNIEREEAKQEEKAMASSQTTAMVLFGEKVEEAYTEHSSKINLRHVKPSYSSQSHSGAFNQGHAVGSKIRLNSKELKG